jgi:hypothetical protein
MGISDDLKVGQQAGLHCTGWPRCANVRGNRPGSRATYILAMYTSNVDRRTGARTAGAGLAAGWAGSQAEDWLQACEVGLWLLCQSESDQPGCGIPFATLVACMQPVVHLLHGYRAWACSGTPSATQHPATYTNTGQIRKSLAAWGYSSPYAMENVAATPPCSDSRILESGEKRGADTKATPVNDQLTNANLYPELLELAPGKAAHIQ